ncbi:hypothetical protein ABPG74_015420 [Tetrahymena malaccensis]
MNKQLTKASDIKNVDNKKRKKSPSPNNPRNSLINQESNVQQLNPWEIDHLIYMNRLLPQYQKIVNRGQTMEKGNYKIFVSYNIQATISNIYYCQEFNKEHSKKEKEQNYFTSSQIHSNSPRLNQGLQTAHNWRQVQEYLKFIPKVMRITPKLFQNQPIEGLFRSEYLKNVFNNECCRYQHLRMFVRYFDFFEDDKNIYTVTEQYESNLKTFLMKNYNQNDLIPEEVILDIIFQIYLPLNHLFDNKLKIIQSLKLTSILVDSKKKIKIPIFSYSTFNLNPKSMPTQSIKYLAPEIISSNYKIEPSQYQSSWTLGVLLLDILLKGYENGPFDLQNFEQNYTSKVQKDIITNKILTFNIDKYMSHNSSIFSNYSPQFIDFIKLLLSPQVTGRIKLNQIKNHQFFQNNFSYNKFYNSRKINVSLSNQNDEKRIPFSLKEINFD